MSQEMVTVLVASDAAEQAFAESVLREAGIAFSIRHAGVQHLVGAGQIGGVNIATGPPEIQVASSDFLRANTLLREELGQAEPPEEPAEEARERTLAARYARYSAAWAVLALWGLGSLLGIFFGIQALRRSRGALPLTKGLAVFGICLGLFGLVALTAAVWTDPSMPRALAYLFFLNGSPSTGGPRCSSRPARVSFRRYLKLHRSKEALP